MDDILHYNGTIESEEERQKVKKRYEEIKDLKNRLWIKEHQDMLSKKIIFEGYVPADIKLDEMDILILVDNGNLAFGGKCFLNEETNYFNGFIWID